jgi:hypothetical protein
MVEPTLSGREVAYSLASKIDARVLQTSLEFSLDDPAHTWVVVERTSIMPERWWIHCVSDRVANGDDLATCLGMAMLVKPSIVLFAATRGITAEARQFVSRVNSTTNMRIIALDEKDLDRIEGAGHTVTLLLNERIAPSGRAI